MAELWLAPLGLAVGAYGTLIGAGGGFILVPILLLLYPDEKPSVVTAMSLAVVFFNAASGRLHWHLSDEKYHRVTLRTITAHGAY